MKRLSALLAIPVMATGLAIAQDQPATSRDADNPQTASAQNMPQTPQRHRQDYGWLGLFGLLGLLGLRRNRAYVDRTTTIDRGANYTGDVRRAG
jgi:MYXO-CTERM domain-containing protein